MELRDYLFILTKRWILVISILVLVTGLAASAALFLVAPSYQARAQLFVSTNSDTSNSQQLLQGSTFSEDRVKSYADLATSPDVLGQVIADLALDRSVEQIAGAVSARAPVDTVLIDITVEDRSPDLAAALANAVATQLSATIEKIETPLSGGPSPIRATIVRKASAPPQPVSPNLTVYLAVGLMSGLLLSVGLAMLLEKLDTSVKSSADLARVTGLPVLATVVRDNTGDEPIVRDDAHSRRSEAYRQLRTNLQFASIDEKPRIVAVTSAVEGEGKSSIAGNLAMTLAQAGIRVCLVDADLRRPSVADYFGLVGEAGLTTVLIGNSELSDVIQPVAPNFDAITSGAIPPNPSELLASERTRALMSELASTFDMVIFDCPPTLPVADATVLANAVDGVLFVVRVGRTTKHQAEVAIRGLEQVKARMLGVVLNMAPAGARGGAYYGYGYSYRPENRTKVKAAVRAGVEETAPTGHRVPPSSPTRQRSANYPVPAPSLDEPTTSIPVRPSNGSPSPSPRAGSRNDKPVYLSPGLGQSRDE